jgi:hypothetical protein
VRVGLWIQSHADRGWRMMFSIGIFPARKSERESLCIVGLFSYHRTAASRLAGRINWRS